MSQKEIFRFWLPLAFSWLLMTVAGPWVEGVISRQSDAQTQLAAFGLVMSLSITIEAPVIMLLATSTALVRNGQSYRLLWRYAVAVNLLVTVIAAVFAFTPVFDWWLDGILGIPANIRAAAKPGMAIMLFWSALIGFRRFYQGVLIRNGNTKVVGQGTILRVVISAGLAITLGIVGGFSGVVIGSIAMVISVGAESAFAYWKSRPVVAQVLATKSTTPPLTYRLILTFHVPLALTSLMALLVRPLIESGLASTSEAEKVLAAWPVIFSVLLVMRSGGMAYQEVVIALSKGATETQALRRFMWAMGFTLSGLLLIFAWTPLVKIYAADLLEVPDQIQHLVVYGVRAGFLLPLLTVLQSYLRAMLMRSDTTSPIYQAMASSLAISGLSMWLLLQLHISGVVAAALALTIGTSAEVIYLWLHYLASLPKLTQVWQPAPVGD